MTNQTESSWAQRLRAETAKWDPVNIAREIFSAAERAGEDGIGRDGLVGYFRKLAREYPRKFIPLLVRAIREIVKQLKYRRKGEAETDYWIPTGRTDKLEAVILAATQIGNDGRGQGGLVGYVSRFAREKPELFYDLLEMLIPYRILWAPTPQRPTLEEQKKQLRALGIQVLFHGDEFDENGHPFNDGGPWPRIRNIDTGKEFTLEGVRIRTRRRLNDAAKAREI